MGTFIILVSFWTAISGAWAEDANAPTVDLRRNGLTRVRNQGWERNTCNAFAATALAEFLLLNHSHTTKYADTLLSEEYTYWAGRKLLWADANLKASYEKVRGEGPVDGLPGFLAVEGLREGLVSDKAWAYEMESPCKGRKPSASKDCWVNPPPPRMNVLPWRLEPIYIPRTDIARFIVEKRTPVVMNIDWYEGLEDRGEVSMPNPTQVRKCETKGEGCDGHVILLVGYNSRAKTFYFRNSYGTSWGNQGYGEIPEEYIVKHCEACKSLKRRDLKPWQRSFVEQVAKGVSARLVAAP